MLADFHDREILAALRLAAGRGVRAAAENLLERCREALNVPARPVLRPRQRSTVRGPRGSSYESYPATSRPGEPPRRRSGTGRASVAAATSTQELSAAVGVSPAGRHLIALELGTRRVAPRPWLVATLLTQRQSLGRAAVAAMQRELP